MLFSEILHPFTLQSQPILPTGSCPPIMILTTKNRLITSTSLSLPLLSLQSYKSKLQMDTSLPISQLPKIFALCKIKNIISYIFLH